MAGDTLILELTGVCKREDEEVAPICNGRIPGEKIFLRAKTIEITFSDPTVSTSACHCSLLLSREEVVCSSGRTREFSIFFSLT